MIRNGFGLLWKSALGIALLAITLPSQSASADDIIDVDYTGVAAQYRFAFIEAERRLDQRIIGYADWLPRVMRNQLSSVQITASTPVIDGQGGILGQAAPNDLATARGRDRKSRRMKNYALPINGFMQFDIADIEALRQEGSLVDVVFHEMAHVLGFGSLWADNELISPFRGVGNTQYTYNGYALEEFRREARRPFTPFVPIEQQGGGGTALAHWEDDDPFFNQVDSKFLLETMTGFNSVWRDLNNNGVVDAGEIVTPNKFVSETTWGSLADLGYVVTGISDNDWNDYYWNGRRRPHVFGNGFPGWVTYQRDYFAVPEPGAACFLTLMVGLGLVRRRR